jgi:hypothetical protein
MTMIWEYETGKARNVLEEDTAIETILGRADYFKP